MLDSERFKVPIRWDSNEDLIDIINENDGHKANNQPERVAEEILLAKAKSKLEMIEKNDTLGPGSYRINETQVVKNVHCPTMAKSNSERFGKTYNQKMMSNVGPGKYDYDKEKRAWTALYKNRPNATF